MDKWIQVAMDLGATEAGWLDTGIIRFLPEVRKMCVDGKCGGYGKNWACPPGCGSVEACAERVRSYQRGLVFTVAAQMEDPFDYEAIEEGGKKIKQLALAIRDRLWDQEKERVLADDAGALRSVRQMPVSRRPVFIRSWPQRLRKPRGCGYRKSASRPA